MAIKHYEVVFIVTPVLSDSETTETIAKFEGLLKGADADVYHSEDMGLRKLAYPIDKKSTGHYHLFEFKADPSIIAKFEIELKRDENILRFLTVSLDKHGVDFNARRRNGEWAKKSETEEKSA
ncbi:MULTISPECIES: 30S ribosomal protein S6 [Flammeovirga]|uniref:Small ribosomal subunit protein bS6 n=1 Tax=Flammeovirga agarivorans TaxID=2726742 RepID=A0A7X8XWZ6_9BACT|nr:MULTISPECIES: 30S ribosomal protein S6 [Flammeovirga]NLR92585.1 30S ribosomal protein S6 [Flammeovirga agarivorans]